ncbi:tripartite tricarboxylate transporter permease [Georgenia alba]|uniref:Tripartite tricarboxylate transporter permease n=1 Tax=Georgenia alba TaxID=2233858 RepID=A0ABW2Q9V5_9MICO
MTEWAAGLETAFQWQSLLYLLLGLVGGVGVGAVPGLSATMGIAVLLPFTFVMDPLHGMMLLLGIYTGAVYAGSIPAILIRLPGTPASAATVLDGYAMTQQGKGGQALTISLVTSCVGALIGGVLLALFAPLLADVALLFGPAEYTMLALFALAVIGSMSEGNLVKGIVAGIVGLLVATIGIDPIDGYARFTFGLDGLTGGIGFIPVLIGLFGVAEGLVRAERHLLSGAAGGQAIRSFAPERGTWRRLTPGTLYSSLIGFVVGVLPGTGGDIGSFVGHNEVRRISKNTEMFGRGDPRGLAAAESANNSSVPGTVAPTLVLGIPGNSAAAVLIGAITVHGLRPGPQLFTGEPDLVYGIFVALIIAPLLMLLVGGLGIRLWSRITWVPQQYLWPAVLTLCVIGAYAIRTSLLDVMAMTAAGVLGYLMIKGGFPLAPVVIGLIVGPILEANFRRATIVAGGSFDWVLAPLPLVLLLVTVLTLGLTLWRAWRSRRETAPGDAADTDPTHGAFGGEDPAEIHDTDDEGARR